MDMPRDMTPEGWDDVAEIYDRNALPFTSRYAEDALRLAALKTGERVLDVATGSGSLALVAAGMGARVTATDFSPGMIDRLRQRLIEAKVEGVEVAVMDGQALDIADGSYDAAFSLFGLIFFPDRVRGFRELHRVLKPGGRAAVVSWNRMERMEPMAVLFAALRQAAPDLPQPPKPPAPLSLQDPKLLEQEMTEGGFRDVRVETVAHDWIMDSPEEYWDTMIRIVPTYPMVAEQVGAKAMEDARRIAIAGLRERFGEDPVRLRAEAHVGFAWK